MTPRRLWIRKVPTQVSFYGLFYYFSSFKFTPSSCIDKSAVGKAASFLRGKEFIYSFQNFFLNNYFASSKIIRTIDDDYKTVIFCSIVQRIAFYCVQTNILHVYILCLWANINGKLDLR